MKEHRRWFSPSDLFLLPILCAFVFPFYYLIVSTMKTQSEIAFNPVGLPAGLNLENYRRVLGLSTLGTAFTNTLLVTVLGVVAIVLVGQLAAYPIVFNPNRFNRGVTYYLMIGFLIPFQSILLGLYGVMQGLGLINSLLGLVMFYSSSGALTVFLTVGYMKTIPRDLVEAATIDGCSIPRIFFSIVWPLLKPITTTTIIFNTMWIWNDFIAPFMFLNSRTKTTMVLEIYQAKGQFSVDWPMFMTMSVVTILPIFIFYLVMQKHIVKGLTAGAVKG